MILNRNRHAFDVCLIHLAWRAKKNESGSSSHDGGIALAVRYATGWAKCEMKSPGPGANEFLRLVCKSVMPIIWNYSEPISIANSFHATPDKKKNEKIARVRVVEGIAYSMSSSIASMLKRYTLFFFFPLSFFTFLQNVQPHISHVCRWISLTSHGIDN